MHERFAVVFADGSVEAAGALEVEHDRLLLSGRGALEDLELEIRFADLSAVRVGCRPSERLNGYPTLVLERTNRPAVQVAPLGMALLPEIADLLVSLSQRAGGDTLAVVVPLKPGCLGRARKLLATLGDRPGWNDRNGSTPGALRVPGLWLCELVCASVAVLLPRN